MTRIDKMERDHRAEELMNRLDRTEESLHRARRSDTTKQHLAVCEETVCEAGFDVLNHAQGKALKAFDEAENGSPEGRKSMARVVELQRQIETVNKARNNVR